MKKHKKLTNNDILLKAIMMAERNGFKTVCCPTCHVVTFSTKDIVFNHEFAEAFWGKLCEGHKPYDFMCVPNWQLHLQTMVLYKNPIDYLRKFV